MPTKPPHGLFVTGVNTEVGKTYVACRIARQWTNAGRRVAVYKPAASGAVYDQHGRAYSPDALQLWEAAGRPGPLGDVCPQVFLAPLAPHLAAQQEGRRIDAKRLVTGLSAWSTCELVVVEGAGGLMSPITEEWLVADVANALGYPLVMVAANVLGAIGQTLQACLAARAYCPELRLAAVVLNDLHGSADSRDPSRQSNAAEIRRRLQPPTPVIQCLHHGGWSEPVDWLGLAR